MFLPIQQIVFYKHGLGHFVRKGEVQGRVVRMEFPRTAMDDVLKSLVIACDACQVLSMEFETPQDRNPSVSRQPLQLSADRSLTDLIAAFRGRDVLAVAGDETVEGRLVGLELEADNTQERGRLAIYVAEHRTIRLLPLQRLESLTLCEVGAADLRSCLRHNAREEDSVSAVLRLTVPVAEGQAAAGHSVSISYIAPAPAWRVSYQLLADTFANNDPAPNVDLLLQGWGVFDNTLGEDLCDVRLSLVAGMPLSFRYALHRPHTPERALLADDERTINAPVEFDTAVDAAAVAMACAAEEATVLEARSRHRERAPMLQKCIRDVESSMPAGTEGTARGALFRYEIEQPVSVGRGQSAMVPIVSQHLRGCRDLLFNERKHPRHPVSSWRFKNTTGLCLERGPLTVLEESEYAGEAVLDFTPIDGEVIVAFAVELGVSIHVEKQSQTRLAALNVEPGLLVMQEYKVLSTGYEVTNNTTRPQAVLIEHTRESGYELFDVEPALETTPGCARWRVQCPPQSRQIFMVLERREQRRSETVQSLGLGALEEFLRDRFLDQAVFDRLKSVLELYGCRKALQDEAENIEQRRQQIYTRQTQIQNNLTPLGDQGEEGRLRGRLVAELNGLEDTLASLFLETRQAENKLQTVNEQLVAAMENLRT